MIVVDTNILCYLYLEGEFTLFSESLLEKDANWVAPLLWRSEFRNVIMLYIRKSIITINDALCIIENAEKQMKGHEYNISSDKVINLAAASGCSAYDCEFVSLAMELNIPLITSDKKILNSFPDTAISAEAYCY